MFAIGENFSTLVITINPQTQPVLDVFIVNLNAASDSGIVSECGAAYKALSTQGYTAFCIELFELNTYFNIPIPAPGSPAESYYYELTEANIPVALSLILEPDLYRNLLAYCLIKQQPNGFKEIWDVCVLQQYRAGGALAARVGGSVGKKFIANITAVTNWWLLVKPGNMPAAATYIKNGFQIKEVSRADSVGNLTMPFDCIIMTKEPAKRPFSPAEMTVEIERFKDISAAVIAENDSHRMHYFLPPETVADLKQLSDFEGSEVGGQFVFNMLPSGEAENTIDERGNICYKLYVKNELIKGNIYTFDGRAVVNFIELFPLSFHTHPFSVYGFTGYIVQYPSVPDVRNAINLRSKYELGIHLVLITGGFFIVYGKKDFTTFLSECAPDNFTYIFDKVFPEVYNYFLETFKNEDTRQTTAALGDGLVRAIKTLASTLQDETRHVEYKHLTRIIQRLATANANKLAAMTFLDLIRLEERSFASNPGYFGPAPRLRAIFDSYKTHLLSTGRVTGLYGPEKMQLLGLEFVSIKQHDLEHGVFFSVDDKFKGDRVTNAPPTLPGDTHSPIGDCTEGFRQALRDKVFKCG